MIISFEIFFVIVIIKINYFYWYLLGKMCIQKKCISNWIYIYHFMDIHFYYHGYTISILIDIQFNFLKIYNFINTIKRYSIKNFKWIYNFSNKSN